MPRDKIKAVDVAFFSFPCINETVLRHGTDAQYDDTKSGMLFRESHLQVADALNYPKIICSELVSPHPENFNHHLQVEDMMTDPKRQDCNSYSQTDCSAVVNAAFFSGCVSQPRWIRVFRLKMPVRHCIFTLATMPMQWHCSEIFPVNVTRYPYRCKKQRLILKLWEDNSYFTWATMHARKLDALAQILRCFSVSTCMNTSGYRIE
ncbi:hypothetical protein AURANDRAFT_68285, partial [Aureococcus anophagefferens]